MIDLIRITNQIRYACHQQMDLELILDNLNCIIKDEKYQTQYWFLFFIREVYELQ